MYCIAASRSIYVGQISSILYSYNWRRNYQDMMIWTYQLYIKIENMKCQHIKIDDMEHISTNQHNKCNTHCNRSFQSPVSWKIWSKWSHKDSSFLTTNNSGYKFIQICRAYLNPSLKLKAIPPPPAAPVRVVGFGGFGGICPLPQQLTVVNSS